MPDIDPLADLGVRQGPDGPTLRVFSSSAERLEVVIDDAPHDRVVPLTRDEHDVWTATDAALTPGRRYWLRVDGADHVLAVDHVVLCAGQESVRGLYDDLLAGTAEPRAHLVGGADVAAELDAKRAIEQGTRVAAAL